MSDLDNAALEGEITFKYTLRNFGTETEPDWQVKLEATDPVSKTILEVIGQPNRRVTRQ
jgi:hypothetical protein